jgi:hypothetical protein
MRIYEVIEVNNKPRKNYNSKGTYTIFYNSIYFTAEVEVEGSLDLDLDEDVTDEVFDQMVEEKVKEILDTLKTYGRYPKNGNPVYVAL